MDKYLAANVALSLFSQNYMHLKKDLPIRPSEMGVINIITQTPGPHTSVMLAEMLEVSKPMITAHLASLTEKGYITKEPSSVDKRSFYILPTEKAQLLAERAKEDLNRHLANLEERMAPGEFDTLVRLAQKANEILEKE